MAYGTFEAGSEADALPPPAPKMFTESQSKNAFVHPCSAASRNAFWVLKQRRNAFQPVAYGAFEAGSKADALPPPALKMFTESKCKNPFVLPC